MLRVEILRVSGAHEMIEIPRGLNVMQEIAKAIGAPGALDTVNLRDGRVMLVDDAGYDTQAIEKGPGHYELKPTRARKPVNQDATQLYWTVCRPGTTHQIVGDCAVLVDRELADEGE
jgi:hypothetical protein